MTDHTPQLSLFTSHPDDPAQEIPYGYCHCGCGQRTALAKASDKNKGHVRGEPLRYIKGHNTKRSPIVRFWEKVDRRGPDECWMWHGSLSNPYGAIHVDGKEIRASRFSYELHFGSIPDGLNVLHKCDTPGCINPNHLFLGTQLENMQDCKRKGRNGAAVGVARPNHKLTPELVIQLRQMHGKGDCTYSALARIFNLEKTVVRSAIIKKTWKHVR